MTSTQRQRLFKLAHTYLFEEWIRSKIDLFADSLLWNCGQESLKFARVTSNTFKVEWSCGSSRQSKHCSWWKRSAQREHLWQAERRQTDKLDIYFCTEPPCLWNEIVKTFISTENLLTIYYLTININKCLMGFLQTHLLSLTNAHVDSVWSWVFCASYQIL